jgi:Na+/melibiose symporter-like transporter
MFFGASSLALKLAFGGGALVAGIIVDAVGITGLRSIADVTPEIRWHLGVAMALSVAVLFTLSWLAFRQYDLTRAQLAEIHARLAQRGSAG